MAFADGLAGGGAGVAAGGLGGVAAYDRKTDDEATRGAKQADYERSEVRGAGTNADAIAGAALILATVTADRALEAAERTARGIAPGALYCDMNSVAPATKRAAAAAIERAGGRYVDVAVMAPVHPARRRAPLLIAGPHAGPARDALAGIGFANVATIAGPVGAAAAVKMIRSVLVKGLEALTAECVIAADAAGVLDAVIASLNASTPGDDWRRRADYNLDRMMIHGLRRAAEMEEAVSTLEGLDCAAAMSRGTIAWQRAIGARGLGAPDGLAAKLAVLRGPREAEAA